MQLVTTYFLSCYVQYTYMCTVDKIDGKMWIILLLNLEFCGQEIASKLWTSSNQAIGQMDPSSCLVITGPRDR